MIDFKKVGEAAVAAHFDGDYEAIGRAALAAIIPEPENGCCNHGCPFWNWDGGNPEDLTCADRPGCNLNLEQMSETEPEYDEEIDGPEYDYEIAPGPNCPISKGQK